MKGTGCRRRRNRKDKGQSSMRCQDIIERIEKRFPREYACSWDNVSLLAGDREQETDQAVWELLRTLPGYRRAQQELEKAT